MSLYERGNDESVRIATEGVIGLGSRILQIFKSGDDRQHVRELLERMNPPPRALILDVGCGVGEVSRLMKEMRPDLDFILLNISPSQLEMCPDMFPRIMADAHAIPIADESVDVAMVCYVLGHLDVDQAVPEIGRTLKVGGIMFIVDVTGGEMADLGYIAHDIDGYEPWGWQTDFFRQMIPHFHKLYPNVKPVVLRRIKRATPA